MGMLSSARWRGVTVESVASRRRRFAQCSIEAHGVASVARRFQITLDVSTFGD